MVEEARKWMGVCLHANVVSLVRAHSYGLDGVFCCFRSMATLRDDSLRNRLCVSKRAARCHPITSVSIIMKSFFLLSIEALHACLYLRPSLHTYIVFRHECI